ncbi:hypothetical protein PVAND_006052 [Polypedilum vanderplanki]|uniref:Fatty acyl-CoA reductase n=1 Tax=Polypedilum vanderplanki TaxID=319348 RepID=A0A9J6C308_POLVA|nr:hypothetical protein PVAND_006052 [Polypedilum vanderplanki]
MKELNSVQEFYKDKIIFITGGSGFMGKVLIEKLLYSCSDLKQLILLMRVKKGKSEMARVKEFEALPMFKRIMEEKPEVMKKILVVSGEITEKNLGLSEENLQYVIDNTDIVFHVAASIRFTAPLKENVLTNLVATQETIDIAKKMKNLKAMLHVSTAFCTVERSVIDEKVYDHPGNPFNLISLAKQMDEPTMSGLEDQLVPPHPNTYTYTKRLAELLVQDEYKNSNLPICIVRPSIVGPALKEPMPGWVDSLGAISGIIFGVAKGVIRCMLIDPESNFEYIPVDQSINGFIMVAKQIGTQNKRSEEIPVYNMTAEENGLFTYQKFYDWMKSLIFKLPFLESLWYVNITMTMNEKYFWFNVYMFQMLPALLIDFALMILGKKRYLVDVQRKVIKSSYLLRAFTAKKWKFYTKNFHNLMLIQSPEEKEMFNIDTNANDPVQYFKDSVIGV